MIRRSVVALALPALVVAACAHSAPSPVPRDHAEIVHVAPPTGERDADRASILAALERVRPGGTVQFAAGTYLIGEIIRVPITRVTLLGHAHGTVIRGCDPDAFPAFPAALLACHGFELGGANQTVRKLTFEYTWHGLFIGCCFPADAEALQANEPPQRIQPGGHLVEGNTFRYSPNGIRVIGESPEPTVIRNNTFLDVYHAIGVNGRTVHFLDNHISVRDPARVPISTHPGGAINVTPFGRGTDHTSCADNVIAGNRVEGHPEAIGIWVDYPATSCRNNTVRDNTILVRRVGFTAPWIGIRFSDESDTTLAGLPLFLYNMAGAKGLTGEPGQEAFLENNWIEGNRIIGAEGLGIHLVHASRNHIANNTISAIRPRDPFPGNDLHLGNPPQWSEANGSGILISAGSDENEILANTVADVAGSAIVLEGDRNRVETRSASEVVRDLGSGNQVSGPAAATATDPTSGRVPARRTVDARTGPRRGPIIDMHLHAAAIRSAAHADSVLEWMDRHGVARAVLLVHDTAGLAWRDRAPDRFVAAMTFPCHEGRHPTMQPCLAEWNGWPDPEWLRTQHAEGRLGALGELFNVYYGIPATHERLAPYWALAEELDIPVGIHTGRGPPPARRAPGCCPNFDDDFGNPALLEPVLRRHPALRVWLMHAGGPFQAEAIALMRAFPSVYADMSILNSMAPPAVEAHSLRAFLDAGLGDRIMLGTDNQPLERILERMDAIDFLSEAQRRAILYDNAARFLRLSPEEISLHHQHAERTREAP
jgi:parallel beta-helix repeat protein